MSNYRGENLLCSQFRDLTRSSLSNVQMGCFGCGVFESPELWTLSSELWTLSSELLAPNPELWNYGERENVYIYIYIYYIYFLYINIHKYCGFPNVSLIINQLNPVIASRTSERKRKTLYAHMTPRRCPWYPHMTPRSTIDVGNPLVWRCCVFLCFGASICLRPYCFWCCIRSCFEMCHNTLLWRMSSCFVSPHLFGDFIFRRECFHFLLFW